MMLITTTTIHTPIEAAAAAAMTCKNGLVETAAFDHVPALAARCAP